MTLTRHPSPCSQAEILSARFSPDGNMIAASSSDSNVCACPVPFSCLLPGSSDGARRRFARASRVRAGLEVLARAHAFADARADSNLPALTPALARPYAHPPPRKRPISQPSGGRTRRIATRRS